MAVNLSAREFNDAQLVERVQRVLADSGLPPGLLALEVSEATVMHQPDVAAIRAAVAFNGPMFIRLGRSKVTTVFEDPSGFEIGRGRTVREGTVITSYSIHYTKLYEWSPDRWRWNTRRERR